MYWIEIIYGQFNWTAQIDKCLCQWSCIKNGYEKCLCVSLVIIQPSWKARIKVSQVWMHKNSNESEKTTFYSSA